jgi:uncharacterized protein
MKINNNKDKVFDLHHTIHKLKHYLPTQMTLKDFIHHNSLHAFQKEKFYEGIFRAAKIFGFKATLQLKDFRELFVLKRIKEETIERIIEERKGSAHLVEWSQKVLFGQYDENIKPRIGNFRCDWKRVYKLDLDSQVHPLLYRILGSYLDQGISMWTFPVHSDGFLATMRDMEQSSSASFFKTSKARKMLLDTSLTIEDMLTQLVGDEAYYEQYLFDLCFSHRGWSGMVAVIDDLPHALLIRRAMTLEDMIHFELLMEIDALDTNLGSSWKPLSVTAQQGPIDLFAYTSLTEIDEVLQIWQDAFEWSYYDDVLSGLSANIKKPNSSTSATDSPLPVFQSIFCIDERECSLRRHIEYVQPNCETLGAPGFFGVEFYFRQAGAKFIDKLCPAPVTPKYLIKEYDVDVHHHDEQILSQGTFSLARGFLNTMVMGVVSVYKLFQTTFKPQMSPSISDAFTHVGANSKLTVENASLNDIEDGLQVGFTVAEMSTRVENFLRGIGMISRFSPIVYMMSHGSSSANNPHHGAHDCGACSGRPGCVNARVFAIMANHPEVRAQLRQNGITIPDTTRFIGAMHDTASDLIVYYVEGQLSQEHQLLHDASRKNFEEALDLNAKERSRRFASINTLQDIKSIRKDIEDRSVSVFEPRPELGHGTNSLAIIGRREVTRGLYLDRRAFLNSYDYRTDMNGDYLAKVMAPIGIVCGGINLEYYFSRVDNVKLGCGTKLPHNVVGLLSVANSSDGDLRPGLPWQMIEPHDPVRLLVIVEHKPEVVLQVITSSEAMYEWYKNEWVHIVALDPETQQFYYLKDGVFVLYHQKPLDIQAVENVHSLFESAPQMLTNHVTHATFENLPIYQLENNIKCN